MASTTSGAQPSLVVRDESEGRMNDKGGKDLIAGKNCALRLWETKDIDSRINDPALGRGYIQSHESVCYCVDGEAEVDIEGQRLIVRPQQSWLIPPNASHSYRIVKAPFKALEFCGPTEASSGGSLEGSSKVAAMSMKR